LFLIFPSLRRDTHEIFAEPVDPNEVGNDQKFPYLSRMLSFLVHCIYGIAANKVEEYYEIIQEPMDFGTMRAKLHEGMYKSLEQFEVCSFIKH
jgi:bromodomain-containing protein 7/9